MAQQTCTCASRTYSIHGKCLRCGGKHPKAYNGSPRMPQTATTERGRRRHAKKGG